MSPEQHVKRFLEEFKTQAISGTYEHARLGLNQYLAYLKTNESQTLQVEPHFIDSFREYLYRVVCLSRSTLTGYVRAVNIFYDYLKAHKIVKENPVRRSIAKRGPTKERSYTDEEIFRGYIEAWRKQNRKVHGVESIFYSYRKIKNILTQYNWRLQTMELKDLREFASVLDTYLNEKGQVLYLEGRERTFCILKSLLRWSHRNGVRKDDFARGVKYQFTPSNGKIIIQEEPMALNWQNHREKYLGDLRVRLRPRTVRAHHRSLKDFLIYLTQEGIEDAHQITLKTLEDYRDEVYRTTLADQSKWSKLAIVKYFMKWLEKRDHILSNPAHKLDFPKGVKGLPTRLMSPHEANMILGLPDTNTPVGLRDRTLFEVMYSSGIRAGEAAGIRLEDINFEEGLLRVEDPKGGPSYQRVVPIGQIALQWIKRYTLEARDTFPRKPEYERRLFLTTKGGPVSSHLISHAMENYCIKGGMRKKYSSHSWRVTCATQMLKNQADIRYVQEQLGHRVLTSTQIYTRLTPTDLKKIHEKTHPREKDYRRLKSQTK